MMPIWRGPWVWSKTCQSSIHIIENVSERELIADPNRHSSWVKIKFGECRCPSSRVCWRRMKAMRAWTYCSFISNVKIVKLDIMNLEIFFPCCNYSMRKSFHSDIFCIFTISYDESPINLCSPIYSVASDWKFQSSHQIISNFEINPSYVTYSLGYCTISPIFVTREIYKTSCDNRILPMWIRKVLWIVGDWGARILSWNKIVENSQTITTVRMSHIVSEFT